MLSSRGVLRGANGGKKQRTHQFHECGVSTRSIQRLIARLKDSGQTLADFSVSDSDLYKKYGHLLTSVELATKHGTFTWELGKPGEIIKAYLESAALAPHTSVMLSHRGTQPTIPLRLILYCDEITPG